MRAALSWLADMTRRDAGMPNVLDYNDLFQFLSWLQQWKSIVRRAIYRSAQWHQVLAKANQWHRDIFELLDQVHAIVHAIDMQNSEHICILCERSFGSKEAWFLHASQKTDMFRRMEKLRLAHIALFVQNSTQAAFPWWHT